MARLRPAIVLLAVALSACRGGRSSPPLVVAMEQDVLTLDPHRHDDSVTHSVLANVYDALVAFDPEMHVVPALAEGWSSPTDLSWRFRLRPSVRFHDGRPLRAADVKYSLERARRMRPGPQLQGMAGVDVLDEATLELRTVTPEPILLNKLAGIGIVPEGTPEEIVRPVGTGAYRVGAWERGRVLRLEANDDYWGGSPAIRSALFRVLPDAAARGAALARGEVHLARELTRGHLAGAGEEVQLLSRPGLVVVVLGVHFGKPGPLLSRDVRQAIYWAVDPRELIERSGVEAVPVDQIVPPSVFGYLPRSVTARPQPERARELLRRAGYPDGFSVTLEMPEAFSENVGRALSEQLARVGIRLTVAGLDWHRLSARLDRRESPFFSVGWSCNGDASHAFDALLHSQGGGTWGSSNFGSYADPALDRAVERAGRTLAPEERLEALHEAMRLVLQDQPLIPLFNRNRTYGVLAGVSFRPRLNGQVLLREIAWSASAR